MRKYQLSKMNLVMLLWLVVLTIGLALVIFEHISYVRSTKDTMDSLAQQIFQLQAKEQTSTE